MKDPMYSLYGIDYLMENLYLNPVTPPYLLIYSTSRHDVIPIENKVIEEFRKFRNVQIHSIDGGHDVHLLQPEIVAPIISKFLLKYQSNL